MSMARQLKLKPVMASKIVAPKKAFKESKDAWESGETMRRWKPGELRGNRIDPARFVKMAGAMEAALEDMRVLYQSVCRMQEISEGPEPDCIVAHKNEVDAILNEIIRVTERLRHGLKARITR